jgi:magnesium-transporting ATPase (P-type)
MAVLASDALPLVSLVRPPVPGRLRVKVRGLYRCEPVRRAVEDLAHGHADILSISANELTGHVLICHVVGTAPDAIIAAVEASVRDQWRAAPVAEARATLAPAPPKSKPKPTRPRRDKTPAAQAMALAAAEPPPQAQWHAREADAALRLLDSRADGLAESDAARRLAVYGGNRLAEKKSRSALSLFAGQFANPPVAMLGVSAGISIATGGVVDAVAILGVVLINAAIGYITESEAEKTINALGNLGAAHTLALREGREAPVPVEAVVPGDVLVLRPGSQVAADARLLKSSRLTVDESSLTGESLPVAKNANGPLAADAPLADRHNIWLGLAGMEDSLRPGMADLMGKFHRAGIQTVMITGDQSATAYSVGRRLGMNHDKPLEIVDSNALEQLDPDILAGMVKDISVFARVSPAHKLRIVQALQKAGRVVAMTGDGVNDGPALKAANIGVAMGEQGTDVARSVSDVVLEDDNLHTMIAAVEQGRTIYRNIRKSLRFLLSSNLSEIEIMLVGTALGHAEILNPMQLLWINLITDILPGIGLAVEPPEKDVLDEPPRDPNEPIVRREDMLKMLRESLFLTGGALAVHGLTLARTGNPAMAGSHAFMTLTTAQLLHSISCRSETTTALNGGRPANRFLSGAVAGSVLLQLSAVAFPPLRNLLRLTPPGPGEWLMIGLGAGLPFVINEAIKVGAGATPKK